MVHSLIFFVQYCISQYLHSLYWITYVVIEELEAKNTYYYLDTACITIPSLMKATNSEISAITNFFLKFLTVSNMEVRKGKTNTSMMTTRSHSKTKSTILAYRWFIRNSIKLNIFHRMSQRTPPSIADCSYSSHIYNFDWVHKLFRVAPMQSIFRLIQDDSWLKE